MNSIMLVRVRIKLLLIETTINVVKLYTLSEGCWELSQKT